MKIQIRTSLVFTAVMLFFVAVLLVTGMGYPFNVKIAPYAVGIPTLILLVILLLGELHPEWRIAAGGNREGPESKAEENSDFTSWAPVLNLFGWVFGFYAAVFLFGFMVATPIFLAAFLRRKAGVGLIGAVSSGILCTLLATWFVQGVFKIPLWLGAIPGVVPGILGGSIVPPL
ncbi:MAG: hypothetical protein CVU57_28975 [Deltaproteobacteria bacterium HGW-Deltaproteobacteria-15]|jgi:hypothetical protein|nr:MAG: hypothetical protein CVU57_28975 [Deltaproteobacteria bacterium HGW-Deltaproteobacteria-15]